MKPEWEEGSENVFMDLGFSEIEADHLMIRSRLMLEVEQFVERSNLSQREAAKKLGVTQPRLNDLLQGKIQKFSIDALVKIVCVRKAILMTHQGKKIGVKVLGL